MPDTALKGCPGPNIALYANRAPSMAAWGFRFGVFGLLFLFFPQIYTLNLHLQNRIWDMISNDVGKFGN